MIVEGGRLYCLIAIPLKVIANGYPPMDFNQLKRFVTTVEGGILGKAAEILNVSQPGLSKSIRQLEADFGAQLLDRGPKGVACTAFGQAVYLRAKKKSCRSGGTSRMSEWLYSMDWWGTSPSASPAALAF
jgi:hypothetical protein